MRRADATLSSTQLRIVLLCMPLRVLLANHHPIVRSNLRLLLEREPDTRVVAEAANGREAVALADYRHPDIALLDINLPHLNGIAAAREILSRNSKAAVIFVSPHPDEAYVSEALKAGARAYVMESTAETDLHAAIEAVRAGRSFVSPSIVTAAIDELTRNVTKPPATTSAPGL
jgi:DNA-binding NarL/FixJ family response regulator